MKRHDPNYTLAEAAGLTLEVARQERWALLQIALLKGEAGAQYWFAINLLEIVEVQGRRREATQSEALPRNLRRDLTLNDSMNALIAADEAEPRFVDLCVTKSEFKKYLKWARTVQ